MSFTLKKAKPVRVMLGDTVEDWEERKAEAEEQDKAFAEEKPDESENMILLVRRVKVEKLMRILAEHQDAFDDIRERTEEAKESGKKGFHVTSDSIAMMADVKDAVLEATCGWENVVDEDGNPMEYSAELLEEEVSRDFTMYAHLMRALNAATAGSIEATAKN